MIMTEKRLTAERQYEIRYHVQQYFIPEMVESVKDGYLPFIALFLEKPCARDPRSPVPLTLAVQNSLTL